MTMEMLGDPAEPIAEIAGPVSAVPSADRRRSPHFLMALLYVGCLVSYVDRQLISLLMSDIQKDLKLEDWQLGFVSGSAFALFYIGFGIPLARLADRANRVRMLALCLAAWSAMTAVCGMAASATQLALARVGVAVGEAGGYPASLSLISDLYPPHRRASVTSIFFSATTAGALVALVAGGYLNDLIGWRWTFVAAATPGVLLAILLMVTREPRRGAMDMAGADVTARPASLWLALKVLFADPFYRAGAIAMTVTTVSQFSVAVWSPTYALRAFGLSTTQAGLGLGLSLGVGSGLVLIVIGRVADVMSKRSATGLLQVAIVGQLACIPLLMLAWWQTSFTAFCVIFAFGYGGMASIGPMVISATQMTIPGSQRGTAATLLVMLSTLFGLGLGPMLVGVFSDLMPQLAADERLRRALIYGLAFNGLGAVLLIWTARIQRRMIG
jgi:MFS family permease